MIAEILANPEPHARQTYPLLGTVDLTPPEIAEFVEKHRAAFQ
jgi:hypothetical protein